MILHPKIFPWQRLGSPAMTQNLGGVAFAVPLFPSIVERVQSGSERSRGEPLFGAAERTLDGEDRSEIITEGRKGACFRLLRTHYRPIIPKN